MSSSVKPRQGLVFTKMRFFAQEAYSEYHRVSHTSQSPYVLQETFLFRDLLVYPSHKGVISHISCVIPALLSTL